MRVAARTPGDVEIRSRYPFNALDAPGRVASRGALIAPLPTPLSPPFLAVEVKRRVIDLTMAETSQDFGGLRVSQPQDSACAFMVECVSDI